MKKKLNLLEQALAEEKQLQIGKLEKASRGAKNNLDILTILIPKYQPQPKQHLYHQSRARKKVLKGGYGSGKTIALCAEMIALAYLNRPIRTVISSATEEIIEDTTLETLKMLCDENNIAYDYTSTNGLFKMFFGDKNGFIKLIGGRFYKGPNIAALGIDEPFSQRKKIVDNLIARVRNKQAVKRQIIMSGTAEPDEMEWGFEYFDKDEDTPDLFSITIPTSDNKHLPKEYIPDLMSQYDAKLQETYLEGKLVLRSNAPVYHGFERKKNVRELTAKEGDYDEIILGVDFNVDPMSAALIGLNKGIFHQIKEWSLANSNTKELCQAVIAYLASPALTSIRSQRERKKSIIITGDATGRKRGTRGYMSDYEIIRDEFTAAEIPFYFNVPMENPAVRDRVNFVNKLFESERFFMDGNCTRTIRDRELVSWKQQGEGFIIDKSKKDLTHLSDAADYAVYNNQILLSADKEGTMVYTSMRKGR